MDMYTDEEIQKIFLFGVGCVIVDATYDLVGLLSS